MLEDRASSTTLGVHGGGLQSVFRPNRPGYYIHSLGFPSPGESHGRDGFPLGIVRTGEVFPVKFRASEPARGVLGLWERLPVMLDPSLLIRRIKALKGLCASWDGLCTLSVFRRQAHNKNST